MWPVQKPNGTWNLSVDQQKLCENSENSGSLCAAVLSVKNLIFAIVQAPLPWMPPLDKTEPFVMVSLQAEDQEICFYLSRNKYTFA